MKSKLSFWARLKMSFQRLLSNFNLRYRKIVFGICGALVTIISIWYAYNGNKLSTDSNSLSKEQLDLSKKADSISSNEKQITEYGDLQYMYKVLDEVKDIPLTTKIVNLKFSSQPDVNAIVELREALDKGIQNKLVLSDEIIKPAWNEFHQKTRLIESKVKIYDAMGHPQYKEEEIKQLVQKFPDDYRDFVNLVWIRLDTLQVRLNRNTSIQTK